MNVKPRVYNSFIGLFAPEAQKRTAQTLADLEKIPLSEWIRRAITEKALRGLSGEVEDGTQN